MKTKISNITGKITLHTETKKLFIISPCTVSGTGSPFIGQRIFSSRRHELTPYYISIIQADIAVVKAKNGLFEFAMMATKNHSFFVIPTEVEGSI